MTLRTTSMVVAMALVAGAAAAQDAPALTSPKEKRSYALGVNIGTGLGKQGMDIDAALLAKGLQDALSGKKTLLTQDEVQAVIAEFQAEMQKKQAAAMQQLGETNKKAGEGKKPAAEDTVVCHYRGTLIDGTEFDSSYSRNEPLTIPVNRIIRGWSEALQLMPVGSKWQLVIPANLAYGERGTPGPIGPNAVLIFEVELLSIKEKPATATAPAAKP